MKPILFQVSILTFLLLLSGCDNQKSAAPTPQIEQPKTVLAQENISTIATKLSTPAFGNIDGINDVTSPKPGAVVPIKSDKVAIGGFAVDSVKGDAAAGVIVMINGKPFITTYGGERPDIAKALNNSKYQKSQFYVQVPTAVIGSGLHELKIRVVASDKSGYYESDAGIKLDIK